MEMRLWMASGGGEVGRWQEASVQPISNNKEDAPSPQQPPRPLVTSCGCRMAQVC